MKNAKKIIRPKVFGVVLEYYAGGAIALTKGEALEAIKEDIIEKILSGKIVIHCDDISTMIKKYEKTHPGSAVIKELTDSRERLGEVLGRMMEPHLSEELVRKLNQ